MRTEPLIITLGIPEPLLDDHRTSLTSAAALLARFETRSATPFEASLCRKHTRGLERLLRLLTDALLAAEERGPEPLPEVDRIDAGAPVERDWYGRFFSEA